jgi:hypothetical protein
VVQRCVGKHQSEVGVAGSDRGIDRCVGQAGQYHDWTARARHQPFGWRIDVAQASRPVEVGDHDRERLVLAVLTGTQRGDTDAGRVGREVVPAKPFDRDYPPRAQGRGSAFDRVTRRGVPRGVDEA